MIVLLGGVGPLVLTKVTRNDDGSLKSGHVVNGAWNFEIRDGEYLCKGGSHIETRFKIADCAPAREVAVPKDMERRNYNKIIEWAEKQ